MPRSRRFDSRAAAGKLLGQRLKTLNLVDPIVLALPRGGVPVGVEVARALAAPLDLVLVRKIGLPYQRELAAAAVVDGATPEIVVNDDVLERSGIDRREIDDQAQQELAEIERRRQVYLKGRPRLSLEQRTLVVVDDGIATGASIRAAMTALRRKNPRRIVLAVPVAPDDTLDDLQLLADDIICLEIPKSFRAVGLHYVDFHQMSDKEVVDCLAELDATA